MNLLAVLVLALSLSIAPILKDGEDKTKNEGATFIDGNSETVIIVHPDGRVDGKVKLKNWNPASAGAGTHPEGKK